MIGRIDKIFITIGKFATGGKSVKELHGKLAGEFNKVDKFANA